MGASDAYTAVPKPMIGAKNLGWIRRKNWQRRAAFLKNTEGELVARARRSTHRQKEAARPPIRFLSSASPRTRPSCVHACVRACVAVVIEKRGRNMKSIRSHRRDRSGEEKRKRKTRRMSQRQRKQRKERRKRGSSCCGRYTSTLRVHPSRREY